jgi:hypothetical protein
VTVERNWGYHIPEICKTTTGTRFPQSFAARQQRVEAVEERSVSNLEA